jgi:hypothetical protein
LQSAELCVGLIYLSGFPVSAILGTSGHMIDEATIRLRWEASTLGRRLFVAAESLQKGSRCAHCRRAGSAADRLRSDSA